MIRGIGLRGAIAVNVITMIGIGPLITIPLVLTNLHGSLALVAWIVGAVIALCDGLIWAELGSRYPGSGGTYLFLREAFGRERLGRMLAFLFTWQAVLSVPLLLASGYIGFAHYAAYLWPPLADPLLQGIVAAAVALITVALLYRPIGSIARTSIAFGIVAAATLLIVILASASHFAPAQAVAADPHAPVMAALFAGLGPALIITLYDYYGYGQVCFVGEEVHQPQRTLPLSIVSSLAIVAALYILLQIGVLGAVPWTSIVATAPGGSAPPAADYVASTVVEVGWGVWAARLATVAILVTAFASTFGNLLGFSRVPYAAARDGIFFQPFGVLHKHGQFPHVSLLVIGLLAVPFCFLRLDQVIAWLTTATVLIQNFGQIAALIALRLRGERAPYRMWLFPIPMIVAAAGWGLIFSSAERVAIAFGLATLCAGLIAYLILAKFTSRWPFAIAAASLVAALLAVGITCTSPAFAASPNVQPAPLPAETFTHVAIVEHNGYPVFEVDGKPFFVYGAAFFYGRLPRSEWVDSMTSLKQLGINTLDLYVMWNWHELKDGDFDFDGHTNPRRDLRYLLKLARENGFKLIVRPGPVIRNEWRNGGYPAWLLQRPEYGMPLHDLLEGRYPPTATLQNAHSDDAAAEWMRNTTHMRYSARWIRRALEEFRPYADLVLAVQLDDDQGAYLDNQTWPAPHLTAYLNHLKSVVHSVTGPLEPVFINTYQMKVTASSPVWAMGNWYQSDAYSIGEHDRAQLEFSTGLLQTRPHQPLMYSEFQAGWLLGPDDIRPRPADPSNTLLAMTTLLGMGVRGIVNFPAQDTLYPTGWEAPFANWFYAWDAALRFGNPPSAVNPRWKPTVIFGSIVQDFGPDLAAAQPLWDAGIVYPISSRTHWSTREVQRIADRVAQAQEACRNASAACRLVDLRYAEPKRLEGLPVLFLPLLADPGLDATSRSLLKRYVARGGTVVQFGNALRTSDVDRVFRRAHYLRILDNAPGATFASTPGAPQLGFLFLTNYDARSTTYRDVTLRPPGRKPLTFARLTVPARTAVVSPVEFDLGPASTIVVSECRVHASNGYHYLVPFSRPCQTTLRVQGKLKTITASRQIMIDGNGEEIRALLQPELEVWTNEVHADMITLRRDAQMATDNFPPVAGRTSLAFFKDVFADGKGSSILENAAVRLIISPRAGARAFVFEDKQQRTSIFTTVGALRDDVKVEPTLSKTDRIAKYTHQFPAGMFNRAYSTETLDSGRRAVVRFTYDAPDVVPAGAHFERTVTLEPDSRFFTMDERVTFNGEAARIGQRAVSVTSLAVGDSRKMTTQIVLAPKPSRFAADKTLAVAGNALGFYDTKTHELATIAWRPGDIEEAQILERHYSIVTRLTLARGRVARTAYGCYFAETVEAARAKLAEAGATLQGQQPMPANTTSR